MSDAEKAAAYLLAEYAERYDAQEDAGGFTSEQLEEMEAEGLDLFGGGM